MVFLIAKLHLPLTFQIYPKFSKNLKPFQIPVTFDLLLVKYLKIKKIN